MKKKPNMLFILMDHYLYYRHGWDQGPKIQTPYFDKLCQEGTQFTRCYSSNPLCGPSRRSILTGQFSHNHGEVLNDINVPFSSPTYLEALHQGGYRNYYYGKWHAGPGEAHQHQCQGYCYPSYGNAYQTPEYQAYLKEKGLEFPKIKIEHKMTPINRSSNMEEGQLYIQDKAWSAESASGLMQGDKMAHQAMFLSSLVCDQLDQLAKEESDAPFSLRVDFWEPHAPYFVTQEFADLYPPEQIPPYPSFHTDLAGKPASYFYENHPNCCDENFKILLPNPLSWTEHWGEMLSRCYGQITLVDQAMGMILDKLEALGLKEDTLILMTADHGDGLACHGGRFDKASYMAEEVLRVPMVVRHPEGRKGEACDALVGNLDVTQTLLEAAGVTMETPMDSQSLLPHCTQKNPPRRDAFFSETYGHKFHNVAKTMVKQRYKYTENLGDLTELYDLEKDPYELINLALNPEFSTLLEELHQELAQWVEEQNDPFYRLSSREQVAMFQAQGPGKEG